MIASDLTEVTVRRLGDFGAEIAGADIRHLDEPSFRIVEDAFNRYGAIAVRGQELNPGEFHAFIARFGELETHTLRQYTLPSDQHIYLLSNVEQEGQAFDTHYDGVGWHTDLAYKQKPVMATALYCVMCPPEGSDTLIADTAAAYDALPDSRKRQFEGLVVHHSYHRWMATRADKPPLTDEQKAQTPDVYHPLVRTNQTTARKALYLGTSTVYGISGMSDAEAIALMEELVEFATSEGFVYRHKWRERDILMWDNRATLHTGTLFDHQKYKRLMYRIMVKGDTPV